MQITTKRVTTVRENRPIQQTRKKHNINTFNLFKNLHIVLLLLIPAQSSANENSIEDTIPSPYFIDISSGFHLTSDEQKLISISVGTSPSGSHPIIPDIYLSSTFRVVPQRSLQHFSGNIYVQRSENRFALYFGVYKYLMVHKFGFFYKAGLGGHHDWYKGSAKDAGGGFSSEFFGGLAYGSKKFPWLRLTYGVQIMERVPNHTFGITLNWRLPL